MELLIAKLNNVFAFEYVPQFVLVLMNVKRRVERLDFFDDGERSASRIRGRPDDELCIAELEAFTAICINFEAASLFHRATVGRQRRAAICRTGVCRVLDACPGQRDFELTTRG